MRHLILLLLALVAGRVHAAEPSVLVYGGTPAGVAAAISAARDGESVLLVEPSPRIGGLFTHGLSHTDFHAFEGLTGAFLEIARRVETHYAKLYGPDSEQVRVSFRGTQAEPKVNLLILEQMLAEQPKVQVQRRWVLRSVKTTGNGNAKRIASATFTDAQGKSHETSASVFIDATYEGDLMAAAGVAYRVGREGKDEYGESLAPDKADGQLQAYNFRFCMTQNPTNRVLPTEPKGYRREDFAGVIPLLEDGRITKVFSYPSKCIFKAQTPALPNGKYDINDVSREVVRLSLPGENLDWPEGNAAQRQRVYDHHLLWNAGLVYFLQNDPAVPAKFRDEARSWGFCKDEFEETGHIPGQIYVREARRMVGQHVFIEKDTDYTPGDARGVLHPDAIAMGEYGPNCHGTQHDGSRFGGKHTGEFYKSVPPYQIPYGVLVPKDARNLLVPVAASSSHVGFCALRLEPIWTSLGQAAGHAAHQALADKVAVQQVNVPKIQKRLHELGAATIYTSDVLPDHPDFALVQWWGGQGGLHGLAPTPAKPGQRGKNIASQYYETYPGHLVELDKTLDAETAARWVALAVRLGIKAESLPKPDGKLRRVDWLKAARQASPK